MENFIDESFLKKISNLKFILKCRRRADFSGAHSDNRSGVSLEFADFKEYTPDDDFRYIDWNATARLEKIIVKRFLREFDVPVYILLDLSDSMSIGSPPKSRFAAKLSVALTHIALLQNDRVGLFPFNDKLLTFAPPKSGVKQRKRIIDLLKNISPEGPTSLNNAVKSFLTSSREKGLVFILSDFLTEEDYEEGLNRLKFRGDDIIAIQLMDPKDLDPRIPGGGTLIDAESGDKIEIGGGTLAVEEYKDKISKFNDDLKNHLSSKGITHVLTPTDLKLEELLFRKLRSKRVLK